MSTNMESTMKRIEIETEAKVIEMYKKKQINMNVNNDMKVQNDMSHQIELIQNIISEGVKDFESSTGQKITYSDMRRMFG